MDRMRVIGQRKRDGVVLGAVGFGESLGKAWIDAADKITAGLCPESLTPGYDWEVVVCQFNDESPVYGRKAKAA